MENNKIEKMLYDAGQELPTTNRKWTFSDMEPKKKFHVNKVVAACIAFALLVGVGGITVLANTKIDMGPEGYGAWVGYSSNSWTDAKWEMKARGIVIPEKFEAYEYQDLRTFLVSKNGDTYLDALMKNVYNPIEYTYSDNQEYVKEIEYGDYSTEVYYLNEISITAGTMDEDYWPLYFGFENVDGIWEYSKDETSFEYEDITVYGKKWDQEDNECYAIVAYMNWNWIDEKAGVCWSVRVPIDTGLDNELDSMEVVKTIIDLNK